MSFSPSPHIRSLHPTGHRVERSATATVVAIRPWAIPLIAAVALLFQSVAQSQDRGAKKRPPRKAEKVEAAAAADAQASNIIVKVYPVQDLLLTQVDHPYRGGLPGESRAAHSSSGGGGLGGGGGAGGGMGGGGGGMFSVPGAGQPPQVLRQFGGGQVNAGRLQQPEERGEELMEVITNYVAGWDDAGAPVDKKIFRGNLIVRNTVEVHQRLADFLQALRANGAGARTVTIEATWLVLSPQQLEALRQASATQSASPGLRKNFGELSRQTTAIHGRITCLSGQLVHLATGRRQVISSGGTPTVGVGAMGYTPNLSVINLGAVLQVTPVIAGDSRAIVDLQSVVTQWKEPGAPLRVSSQVLAGVSEHKLEGPLVHTMVTVDRADIGTQEWSSTISIPRGQPFYVGSVTLSNDKSSQLEAAQNPELALVIEVSD
jgi:hypothetical protein